jgi:hypothetical protein
MVLVLVCLITLLTFVALAIDLGMMAVARTQCQDAADASAMSGARTLNGNNAANNNYSNATPNALSAAKANLVLSAPIQESQVNVQVGRYVYVNNNLRFEGQFPGPSTEAWSMVKSTVNANVQNQMVFSKLFNFTGGNIQASAHAAHRPRDVAIVLDFSGSMRFASLTGTPTSGTRSSNNPDTAVPTFGHYSSGSSQLYQTSFTAPYDPANISSTTSDGRAPIIEDFYTNASGSTAFNTANGKASTALASSPEGDIHWKRNKNSSTSWCTTAADLLNATASNSYKDAAWENTTTGGYAGLLPADTITTFNGYTRGPGYWGKTFFVWPPDPSTTAGVPNDWRKRYFTYPGSSTRMDDNSRLWNSSGNWQTPGSTTYAIDYAAILSFIKNVGPNPFPSRLQSGRILYYDAIPDTISATYPPSDPNQRFWKDYIDYVLGLMQTGSSSWTNIIARTGYGDDFTYGTVKITANSTLTASGSPATKPYMHYADNPKRPRTHFWFGPLTMVDFLGNYNLWGISGNTNNSRYCWWPGTCHEAPMYACKLGIRAALTDVALNHPNDLVSLITFSVPATSASSGNRFNRARVGLSRDYNRMQEALWYPPSTLGTNNTIRPYDADNLEVPRAMGGTCYSMGLMLAYNQFSANSTLVNYNTAQPAGDAGGNGRRGAQKIVIFETDGMPNTLASATLQNGGTANSYYRIRYNSASPGGSEYPTGVSSTSDNASTVTTQIFNLCTQIAASDTASPPGHSTTSKKALIHCIGFGPVFAPSSSTRASAITTLNQMQLNGNVTDGMPNYKLIYGTESQIAAQLQQAFTQIMQSGVQVSLIH